MSSSVIAAPEGASAVIPRLFCRDPGAEIEFCTTTFGAVAVNRRAGADGRTAHALLTLGPAMLMIESEWPQLSNRAPDADGSSPVALYVYVADVDDVVARAVAAGARELMPPADQFWGDRTAWIVDPAGHVWTVAARTEELTEEERQARLAALHARARTENSRAVPGDTADGAADRNDHPHPAVLARGDREPTAAFDDAHAEASGTA